MPREVPVPPIGRGFIPTDASLSYRTWEIPNVIRLGGVHIGVNQPGLLDDSATVHSTNSSSRSDTTALSIFSEDSNLESLSTALSIFSEDSNLESSSTTMSISSDNIILKASSTPPSQNAGSFRNSMAVHPRPKEGLKSPLSRS